MSPFDCVQTTTESSHSMSTSTSPSAGDVLLKWGHRKRSRLSRAAIEDSSSSVHTNNRRISHSLPPNFSMPPPPPPPPLFSSTASSGRGRKHSPRNLEDPSLGGSESPSRNSQGSNPVVSRSAAPKVSSSGMERSSRRVASSGSAKFPKPSAFSTTQQASERMNNSQGDSASVQSEQEGCVATAPASSSLAAIGNKVTVEVIQWPRIYIALSRKEKEDDFLAMKGTKIPQRPKKRAKNVDRILQCCFPGMWLSELTKSRYEVREKKSIKKQKRRGLKGMEILDSDSD
ncbi:CCR4-NOT transcription complex subunit 3 [Vigna unguiculata]|uniref:CCR4-NOT transcription complex subunit 3 n=1 Tax=Vigna unguiculata TaxID=3917 RepID=UPI001016FC74|nr:CCR4-NOT transcription complex subunit 3 [Vigna unguiculata]